MNKLLVDALKRSGVAVIPTDTIYGIVACALDKKAVERLYKVRRRNPKKPCIILISKIEDLRQFEISPDEKTLNILRTLWPGPVSVILPCLSKKFAYLHRGTRSLAFRLPKKQGVVRLLRKTGPLIAPSANPEGLAPARTITEAKKYFTSEVDVYMAGRVGGRPSKLVSIRNGKMVVLRP